MRKDQIGGAASREPSGIRQTRRDEHTGVGNFRANESFRMQSLLPIVLDHQYGDHRARARARLGASVR